MANLSFCVKFHSEEFTLKGFKMVEVLLNLSDDLIFFLFVTGLNQQGYWVKYSRTESF